MIKRITIFIALLSFYGIASAGPEAAIATPVLGQVQNVCNGQNGAGKISIYGGTNDKGAGVVVPNPIKMRTGFVFKCSANVAIRFVETAQRVNAAGFSTRTNSTLIYSSNAPSAVAGSSCVGDTCTIAADMASALAAAAALP